MTGADGILEWDKGSLTIYKYDVTNAEKDGVWDSSYVSTYPKNLTGIPTLEKTLREAAHCFRYCGR